MSTEAISQSEDLRNQTALEMYHRLKRMGILPKDDPHPFSGNGVELKVSIPKLTDTTLSESQLNSNLTEDSTRCKANEELAAANTRHYLEQAVKTKKPWLHCTKQPGQYSEFVLITPDMARELLEWNNNPRKRVKRLQVESYARDMKNGRWIQTSESVDLDHRGYAFNGQHRLNAIILADQPQVLYMTFNCQVEARYPVDSGVKRNTTEKISIILDNPIGTKLTAVCRSMMRGVDMNPVKYSDAEITEFALKYKDVIEYVAKRCKGHRSDVIAVLAKAILYYGMDRMELFIQRFSDVMFTSKDLPEKRLYEFLQTARHTGAAQASTYRKTVAAVGHYIKNREIRALYERETDIFTWGPNWTLPAKTPE